MLIDRIASKYLASNMYVVSEGNNAILIDPCIKDIPHLNINAIIATHEHFDHISGVNFWKSQSSAKFICSEKCAQGCKNPRKNLSHYFKAFCELQTLVKNYEEYDIDDYSCFADETYINRKIMQWLGHVIEFFETPGHSEGSQCILIDGKILFSGDTLINGFKTLCNIPGGSRRKFLEYSLPRIQKLSGEILVYPGHMDSFLLSDYRTEEENYVSIN